MKSIALILTFLSTVTISAQPGLLPPKPEAAAAPNRDTQGAEVPTLPEVEAPGSTPAPKSPAPKSAGSSFTTISGAAAPRSGSLAFTPSQAPPSAPPSPDSAPPSGPAATNAPGTPPPGVGVAKAAEDSRKVDFLQRSNLILAKLLDSERVVDPFGLSMDPANAKEAPVLADQYEEEKEATVVNNSMLRNALLTLPITGIYPQQEKIVIGARTFLLGDQFGMKLQDLTIRLRFEGIREGEIFFKDTETSEVTSLPYRVLPPEFEPMVKGTKQAPGEGILPMNDLFIVN
jgi:hypothetical protein